MSDQPIVDTWAVGDYCFLNVEGDERHWLGRVTGVRGDEVRVRFGQDDVRVCKASELRRAVR